MAFQQLKAVIGGHLGLMGGFRHCARGPALGRQWQSDFAPGGPPHIASRDLPPHPWAQCGSTVGAHLRA